MIKKTLGLLGLVLSTVLFSCSNDDSNSNSNNIPSSSYITAMIDGRSWSSKDIGVMAIEEIYDVGEMHDHSLEIYGTLTDHSQIEINLPLENLAVGTFSSTSEDFHGTLSYANYFTSKTYRSTMTGGTFTVTISKLNLTTGTISGTFSGTLLDMDGNSITITKGVFNFVTIRTHSTFSNGTMSLSKNGGDVFTMDSSLEDGKYLTIFQNSQNNFITIQGFNHNINVSSDIGTYTIQIPKNIATGTFNLITQSDLRVQILSNENGTSYNSTHLTSGSITISSHNGNNVVGTFSFTASKGTNTVTISNGSFNITHN